MLEWTGERFVPWVDDPALAYEHVHRYAFASRFASGKRVLDLGSGEGYGAALLARNAQSVVGIDIDREAVRHARDHYDIPNLAFVCASVAAVPLAARFDLIVCFETLEHIEEQSQLVAEARRLLAPDGVFLVSTPDKRAYSDEPHGDNPFHARELYFDEFRDLVAGTFPVVEMFAQRVSAGSRIWRVGSPDPSGREHTQLVVGGSPGRLEPVEPDEGDPLYYLAVAGAARRPPAADNFMVDASGGLLESHERTRRRLEDDIANHVRAIQLAEEEKAQALAWKDSRIADLTEALEWRESQVHGFEKAGEEATRYVRLLETTISEKNAYISSLEARLRNETARAERAERTILRKAVGWILKNTRSNRRESPRDREGENE